MPNPLSQINLLQGTESDHDFSTGNTLPLVGLPWALHHWTLQTGPSPWTFDSRKKKLWGLRLTHQPSPWMRDYGSFLLSPFHGHYFDDPAHQSSVYDLKAALLQPHGLEVEMLRYGMRMEMAPSEKGALFVFSGKTEEALRLRFDFDGKHAISWIEGSRVISGMTADQFEGEDLKDFGLHFEGEFDVAPESFHTTKSGGYFVFPEGVKRIEFRIAASFISREMAGIELRRSLVGSTITQIRENGAREWNKLLGRIEIKTDSPEQFRTFYSCLYRCLLFPRFLDEQDAEGRTVHYSPYDGEVHKGSLCADSGFWDTYRTLYPLLALVYPDVLYRMMDGWMNVCRQSGWTPKWASPGARDCMIGTHFDVLVADMVAKGLTDWNVEEAFAYLWKDATEPGVCGRYGRPGLKEYAEKGYIPCDQMSYSVSRTLDYAYDDFCIAQVARYLGKTEEADMLESRSGNFRNVFDASTGFMRARQGNGNWQEPFREFAWGGAYIEGGPWQHRFNVPHDVEGLAELLGGREVLCQKLDEMLTVPPRFESGTYPCEIHEMTEMAAVPFGQYAHSNQPVHNYLFLYVLAGQPDKTVYWVKKVLQELYSPDKFPGDEDNGEMSAWYIWASLGLFPVCPGKGEYLSFQPLVQSAILRSPDLERVLVTQSLEQPLPPGLIGHQDLLSGNLVFSH